MDDILRPEHADDLNSRWDQIIEKAVTDTIFRAQLIAWPEQTLREAGIVVPEGGRIVIHEFDPYEQHIFLPPRDVQLGHAPVTTIGATKEDTNG